MFRWLFSLLLLVFLLGCAIRPAVVTDTIADAPQTTDGRADAADLPTASPVAGVVMITGHVKLGFDRWQDREITAYACPFYATQGTNEGFYILEATVHPSGVVSETGQFEIRDVPPGRYAIVIGPSAEESVAAQVSGRPMIVEVESGQVYDLGEISLP